jgi:hypothetical protein
MFDVALRSREEVVHAKDLVALLEKPVDEVGSEKPRASGDELRLRLS